jgi:TonB family protein
MNRWSMWRFPLIATVGLALWVTIVSSSVAAETAAGLSRFLPDEPGTLWVYLTADGLKRIESLRSLDAEGKRQVDVEELRGAECVRRFSYESRLEGERWVRRGPEGEEILLSPPLQPGTKWRGGSAELQVLSASERVQVPGGTFTSCVKLSKRIGERETFLYLSPGVGLVRETVLKDGAETAVLELAEHQVPQRPSAEDPETAALRAELERLAAPQEDPPVRTGGSIPIPRRIAGVNPEKEGIALRADMKATVVVEILVERDGSVAEVKFMRPAPYFEDAVRKALSTWKYEPVRVEGKPVRAILHVTFEFN